MKNGQMWNRLDAITNRALGIEREDVAPITELPRHVQSSVTRSRRRRGLQGLIAAMNETDPAKPHLVRRDQAATKADVVRDVGEGCEACGFTMPDVSMMHLHHVIPVSRGGDNSPSNTVLLCPNCHALAHRADRTLESPPRDRHELLDFFRAA